MSTTSNFTYTRTPTLADPHGQDEYSSAVSIRRLKFLLRNHRRAIEMFETIRPWQHEQSVWIRPEKNACGTVACAAGWVALTNTIPGFQYTREPSEYAFANDNFYPVVNGRRSDWNTANYSFFGKHTTENIFWNTNIGKEKILYCLRDRIHSLENALKSRGVRNP